MAQAGPGLVSVVQSVSFQLAVAIMPVSGGENASPGTTANLSAGSAVYLDTSQLPLLMSSSKGLTSFSFFLLLHFLS